MPTALMEDSELYYEQRGDGPPLLLLPGALGTGITDFPEQLPFFADHFTVIALDPRGYGKSRPPVRDFSAGFYQRDAEDAYHLMLQLGHRRFSILGWSDGANSATILAAMHPEAVETLIVWGGNAFLTAEELHTFQSMRSIATWSPRAVEPLRAVYGDDLQPLWESYVASLERVYETGGEIYRNELPAVVCPTLILHGAKDPLVAAQHPQVLHDGIEGSELQVYPEGKHNIHTRFASEFNPAVLAFLQRNRRD